MADESIPAPDVLLQLITGYTRSQVLHVAAQLDVAGRLAGGPRSTEELAAALGVHRPSLARLARALAALGIVTEEPDGRLTLTSLGTLLRSDVPGSVRDAALFLVGDWIWQAWGGLGHSVRTGEPAFDRIFGMSNFEYWAHDAEAGAVHDAYFRTMARATNAPIVGAYDFSRFRTIVDVGGGTGGLLAAVLRAHPGVQGVLFDLPRVVTGAAPVLAEAGVADRCQVVGGSFFEAVPSGGDAYLLKYVVHDWDDDRAAAILRRCRGATPAGAVLLLIELLLPERLEAGDAAQRVTRVDLQMLVMTPGGRERTEREFRSLLGDAGFALRTVIPTASAFHILEAVPV